MSNALLTAALDYHQLGMSIIPVRPKDKKPLIPWQEFQSRRAEESEIREWWQKTPDANIGMVCGKISGRSVIDIDTAEGGEALDEMVPDSWLTQMATTPRGGKHHHCEDADGVGNNAGAIPGVDFRGEGGFVVMPPSIGPNGNTYRWVDGYGPGQIALAPVPQRYLDFIYACTNKANTVPNPQCAANLFQQGRRDEDLFHLVNYLAKGGMPEQEIREVSVFIAKFCNPPFSEKEANIKVDSALKRIERKERNLTQEIREWCLSTSGTFLSTEIDKELCLSTRIDKATRSKVLTRLCDEGLIARYGNKRGCFRLIEQECEVIDWMNASTDSYPAVLPFGLHEKVRIMTKNIIVVAGDQNAGKTAFLLNIVKMNMHKLPVWYFSSEMADSEFKSRLSLFDDVPLDSWKFEARERSHGFADVIRPDALNIIDYLEICEEVYKVGGILKEVYERLRGGVAIVALQKAKNRDTGRGDTFGLEKPRLYLSISANPPDGNIIKIVKAKNWQTDINPNGQSLEFKIVAGSRLSSHGYWVHK